MIDVLLTNYLRGEKMKTKDKPDQTKEKIEGASEIEDAIMEALDTTNSNAESMTEPEPDQNKTLH